MKNVKGILPLLIMLPHVYKALVESHHCYADVGEGEVAFFSAKR